MMAIVSEKTGYPTEMLELGMDMESDLGIDSIKRVEILGSVQDNIPGLPEISSDELSEMRTLGEILTLLQSKLGGKISNGQEAVSTSVEIPAATANSGVSAEDIVAAIMTIVSEKTGYPLSLIHI